MTQVLELFQHHVPEGETRALPAAVRVIYSVADGEATFSTDAVELAAGHSLCWELGETAHRESQLSAQLAPVAGEQLVRCDRVELPPGGTAYLHTHRGPGIRCLVEGRYRVESAGVGQTIERHGAWFENGADPVEAHAVGDGTAAFVRVMILPAELLGQSSIRYVRDADRDRPKPQRYQVFVDEPLGVRIAS
jgi:hypothetical protein